MKQLDAEELLSCLPGGRTLFTYGKDWYAVSLLRLGLREKNLEDLKKSALARLFDKPKLRAWLGSLGKKSLTAKDLDLLWPEETETYRLTAGLFDGWTQTSRKGAEGWNIVLQLNLNGSDARLMEKHFPERWQDPFELTFHPIHEGRHRTLAWARIDVDWNSGEALIEEIQNDRLREVRSMVDRIQRENLKRVPNYGDDLDADFVLKYWNQLRLSRQWWDEAMLSASIGFIAEELGIRRIYYHSPLSGEKLKGEFGRNSPPVSLYTVLPKRFCFERTTTLPSFIKRRRRLPSDLWMHRLCL